jgi:hypothetical protein
MPENVGRKMWSTRPRVGGAALYCVPAPLLAGGTALGLPLGS